MRKHTLLGLTVVCLLTSCTPQIQERVEQDVWSNQNAAIQDQEMNNDTEGKPLSEMRVDALVQNLFVPWDIVFTAPNRLLVTERSGAVRAVVDGKLQSEPLVEFSDLFEKGETGLLGMALHPKYEENRFIYVSLVTDKPSGPVLRIERLRDEGNSLVREKVIMDDIPTGQYHAGSRLLFDGDGNLLVTTGDGTTGDNAQNDAHLAGKILRMTDEGTLPDGQESFVLMKGLRNPQGIALLDEDTFFISEHGPSGFDGSPGGDEFNIGSSGDNFGWPLVSHTASKPGMVSPAKVFTPAIAPASALVYKGEMFPEWKGDVFVGLLKGEGLMRVELDNTMNTWSLINTEKVRGIDVGRVRTVVEAPDGSIYFTTSNRDGRGTTRSGDDTIYRLSR